MQCKATTVQQYLSELPEDRRAALAVVRKVILKNLDRNYEEGMQYGMIGYYVPHRVFPAGYHCDPRQPLPFAGLASQKNHMAVYLMSIYGHDDQPTWFQQAWAKTGKKLDMGKCCIRFKRVDDLALDVIGEAIRRAPAAKFIEYYTSSIRTMNKQAAKKAAGKASPGKSPTAKKSEPKSAAKKTPAKKASASKRGSKSASGKSRRS